MQQFAPGDRVERREDRNVRGAIVIAIVEGLDGNDCLIAYDEGGEGWWPESALEAEV